MTGVFKTALATLAMNSSRISHRSNNRPYQTNEKAIPAPTNKITVEWLPNPVAPLVVFAGAGALDPLVDCEVLADSPVLVAPVDCEIFEDPPISVTPGDCELFEDAPVLVALGDVWGAAKAGVVKAGVEPALEAATVVVKRIVLVEPEKAYTAVQSMIPELPSTLIPHCSSSLIPRLMSL